MRIYSYFSLPTDIAEAMRDWPEFVSGEEYSVELKDGTTGEQVTIQLMDAEEAETQPYVLIQSNQFGTLYEKAVGRAIIELLPHTDNLMIDSL